MSTFFSIRLAITMVSCTNPSMTEHNLGRDASVLLAFRSENVRSFRDEFELSLVASAIAEKEVVRQVPWREGGRPGCCRRPGCSARTRPASLTS